MRGKGRTAILGLALGIAFVFGITTRMVDRRRFELPTSRVRFWRSPS